MNWYITKVKYNTQDEQGLMKNVSSQFVVKAWSVTEAEANIIQAIEPRVMGEMEVESAAKSPIVDVFFYDELDYWYKFKIGYTIVDENSGKEKKINQVHLLGANDMKQAEERIRESMSNMLVSFTIKEIIETKFEDVFDIQRNED